MPELRVARSELVLGGTPEAKIDRADALAQAWLEAQASHRVVFIATAQSWDGQMRALIDRHHRRRAADARRQVCVEEPTELAHALGQHSRPDTLIVVDCLTFWLTATLMQALLPDESDAWMAGERPPAPALSDALRACAGPVVLIGQHAGTPPQPARRDLRAILQTLDSLDQQAVGACERVTLMAGGLPMLVKGLA